MVEGVCDDRKKLTFYIWNSKLWLLIRTLSHSVDGMFGGRGCSDWSAPPRLQLCVVHQWGATSPCGRFLSGTASTQIVIKCDLKKKRNIQSGRLRGSKKRLTSTIHLLLGGGKKNGRIGGNWPAGRRDRGYITVLHTQQRAGLPAEQQHVVIYMKSFLDPAEKVKQRRSSVTKKIQTLFYFHRMCWKSRTDTNFPVRWIINVLMTCTWRRLQIHPVIVSSEVCVLILQRFHVLRDISPFSNDQIRSVNDSIKSKLKAENLWWPD